MEEETKAEDRQATEEPKKHELTDEESAQVAGGRGFTYGAIEWTYTKQKPDGTAGGN